MNDNLNNYTHSLAHGTTTMGRWFRAVLFEAFLEFGLKGYGQQS